MFVIVLMLSAASLLGAMGTPSVSVSSPPPSVEQIRNVIVGGRPVLIEAETASQMWLCTQLQPDWERATSATPLRELQIQAEVVGEVGATVVGGVLPSIDSEGANHMPVADWHAAVLLGHAQRLSGLIGSPQDLQLPPWSFQSSFVPCSNWHGALAAAGVGNKAQCVITRPMSQHPHPSPDVCLRLQVARSTDTDSGSAPKIIVSASLELSTFHVNHLLIGTFLIASARRLSSSRAVHFATGAFLAWIAGAFLLAHILWKQAVSSLPGPLGMAAKHTPLLAFFRPRLALWLIATARPVLWALLMTRTYLYGSLLVGTLCVWWFGAFLLIPRKWDGEDDEDFYIAPDGSRVDRHDPEERLARPRSQRVLGGCIAVTGVGSLGLFSTSNLPVSLLIAFIVCWRGELAHWARRFCMWMLGAPRCQPLHILSKREYSMRASTSTRQEIEKLRSHISCEGESSYVNVRPETLPRLWQFARGGSHYISGENDEEEDANGGQANSSWAAKVGSIIALAVLALCLCCSDRL